MINISDELKTAYLKDSTSKKLIVESSPRYDINSFNFFTGDVDFNEPENNYFIVTLAPGAEQPFIVNRQNNSVNLSDYINPVFEELRSLDVVNNASVDIEWYIKSYTTISSETLTIRLYYTKPDGSTSHHDLTPSLSSFNYGYLRSRFNRDLSIFSTLDRICFVNTSDSDMVNVRVQYCHLCVRLNFYNNVSPRPYYSKPTDFSQINLLDYTKPVFVTNDNLVSEEFSLSESLCSEDNIKFGLCEAANCTITIADKPDNYRNRRLSIYSVISDKTFVSKTIYNINFAKGYSTHNPHWTSGPLYNFFYNTSTRYNLTTKDNQNYYFDYGNFVRLSFKLKIANLEVVGLTGNPVKILIYPRLRLKRASETTYIMNKCWYEDIPFSIQQNQLELVQDAINDFIDVSLWVPIKFADYYAQYGYDYSQYLDDIDNLVGFGVVFLDENNQRYPNDQNIQIQDLLLNLTNIQINLVDTLDQAVPEYNEDDRVEANGQILYRYVNSQTGIPLGTFNVDSVEKQHVHDIIKYKLTCYDDIAILGQNAADWHTSYLFGISVSINAGIEFGRQIFSTYWNYMTSVGLESRQFYTESYITQRPYNSIEDSDYRVTFNASASRSEISRILYKRLSRHYTSDDTSRVYVVDVINRRGGSDNWLKSESLPDSYYSYDSLGRGIGGDGSILIEEYKSGTSLKKYCVNSGDYFVVSSECEWFYVTVASRLSNLDRTVFSEPFFEDVRLSNVDMTVDLENGNIPLEYSDWMSRDIFTCDSSITGRDVVHSLVEVSGCFFRLNRYSSKPDFIYCTKSGLYPSEKLYPANDLYPRWGVNDTINMGKYREFIQEDYTVKKYGKIQIRKNSVSNQTKSVVEWDYVGDDSYENVYIIDDNIFYCNEAMVYDHDRMPQVSELLANMWNRISNMDYIPCNLVCIGMPWIECGDRIGVLTKTGGAETFVFHRNLKGIQSLTDVFESEGDEYNKEINDYGYKEWRDS